MNDNYVTLEDFVADAYFRQWVKQPDGPSSHYWHMYLADHPEQADLIQQAVDTVNKLSEATAALSAPPDADEKALVWHNIKERVLAQGDWQQSPFLVQHRKTGWRWMFAAATVLAVIGIGWWWQGGYTADEPSSLADRLLQTNLEQTNPTVKPLLVSLPDGSSVLLQKGSHLRFPKRFSGEKRVVYLTGEAFFEVAKDAKHPFFVYANGLVTKVLGTSFTVKAYASDKDVVVTVRSGRVAVFTQADQHREHKLSSSTLDGVVLTQNQQLVFARQTTQLASPQVISPAVARDVFTFNQANFLFDATPVTEVFTLLEKVYGISITYDKATLGKCRLTADLTDEPLTDKMLIICKSLEATYTITDKQLTVSGPGCGP